MGEDYGGTVLENAVSEQEFLESKGWRCVATRFVRGGQRGVVKSYDYPDHQHDRRGFFTQAEALEHQRRLAQSSCDCLPREIPSR